MLFNSLDFLIFLPIVVFVFFTLPHKYRWILLLFASYYFYMCWKAEYIFLILASTAVDYISGLKIHTSEKKSVKKLFLIFSLATNLGLLFFFKYFNFFNDSARAFLNQFNIFYDSPAFDLLLPVGISFYTFQTLSYTIDIYYEKMEPTKHLGKFALYVSFFPQLVAGPIERAKRLLPQFDVKNEINHERIRSGFALILWGMFKKVVVADNLAHFVDKIYCCPEAFDGSMLLLASYLFAFQIYCDFSGYSDIAIGAARIMGYDLMTNFNLPYFAQNISDFWRRWHISLSTWFRDYVYIPLGGNRVSTNRWYLNLMIVFVVSGFWHGANWTFMFWGFLHGFYLVFSIISQKFRDAFNQFIGLSKNPTIHKIVKIIITFHLALLGWIFFRAASIGEAAEVIKRIFSNFSITAFGDQIIKLGLSPENYISSGFALLVLNLISFLEYRSDSTVENYIVQKPMVFRWSYYYVIAIVIFIFGCFDDIPFIYFQF